MKGGYGVQTAGKSGKVKSTVMKGGVSHTGPAPTLTHGNKKVVTAAKAGTCVPGYADGGVVAGKKSMMRLDRPGRKMGGRVGADCSPLSSAAKTSGPGGS